MKNRIIVVIMLSFVALFVLSGCEKKEGTKEYKGTEIDVKKVYADMVKAINPTEIEEENIDTDDDGSSFGLIFDGYDYENVIEYYYCFASDGKPDEIAIIKVKDDKEAEKLKKVVENHLKTKIDYFATYDPRYVPIVENGIVAAKENYVIYSVGLFAPKAKAIFDNAF